MLLIGVCVTGSDKDKDDNADDTVDRKQTETVLQLTKAITQQILESRGLIGPDSVLPDFLVDRSG